jgi:hypothetical protein
LTDICVFNYTITVNTSAAVARPLPKVLKENLVMADTVISSGAQFYFIPIFYNRTIPVTSIDSMALNLQKVIPFNSTIVMDAAIVGRIISNANASYQQWLYPTLTSNDFISRGGISSVSELVDLPLVNITAKCPANTSCALVIGVFGLAPLGPSQYNLTYLPSRSRLNTTAIVSGVIPASMSSNVEISDRYWFTVPNRVPLKVGSAVNNWTQMLIVGGYFK